MLVRRFPFLLVDRVVEYEPQRFAVGYKNVTANDNFFTGHFPDRKIMPGSLNLSRCITGACACSLHVLVATCFQA